jgi:NAD(P)-dependent dehydrogenase (short-subunit alcohol dehydrogenase family)
MHYLVTAGNRGLGLEFVRQLLDGGERVTTTARRPDDADELHALIQNAPDRVELLQLDVTDPESVARLERHVDDTAIDVLINNAGRLSRGGSPDDFAFDEIMADFRVNAVGTLRVTEACIPALRRADAPKIVNITSKMGSIADNGSGGSYAYRMSKAALNMATRSLARDLESEGMIAAVLHPGWVKTRMGGENALISPEKSIRNMLEVIDDLGPEDSGEFYEWNGDRVPW